MTTGSCLEGVVGALRDINNNEQGSALFELSSVASECRNSEDIIKKARDKVDNQSFSTPVVQSQML